MTGPCLNLGTHFLNLPMSLTQILIAIDRFSSSALCLRHSTAL